MRKIEFTAEQIKELRYESIHHSHSIVRRRMTGLLLKSQGISHQEIERILAISGTTLREYLDRYINAGLAGLKDLGYQGQPSELNQYQAEIVAAIEAEPPATIKEAQAIIKRVTGLARSTSQVSEFLKKTNLSVAKSNKSQPKSILVPKNSSKAKL